MRRPIFPSVLLAAVLAGPAFGPIAAAAVTPGAASLQVDVRSDPDGVPGPVPIESRSSRSDQSGSLAPMNVTVVLDSVIDAARVHNTATASATWASASAGLYRFEHTLVFGPGTLPGTQGFIDGWNAAAGTGLSYTFTTGGDSVLTFDFDRSLTIPVGPTVVPGDFWTLIDGSPRPMPGPGFGATGQVTFAIDGAGVHSFQITPGTIGAADSIGGATREFTQIYTGSVAWSITSVPEPATLALWLAGAIALTAMRWRAFRSRP